MSLGAFVDLLENKLTPKIYKSNDTVYGLHYGVENRKKKIKKVLFTVDLTIDAVYYALKHKHNLIISCYGLYNKQIQRISPPLVKKLSLLARYPFSIFVLNYPFIAAEGGVSESIVEVLYLKIEIQ